MSTDKNRAEAVRWLKTAEDDLDSALLLKEKGKFAHACFHAQQAGEKAIKALWYLADGDPRGHSVRRMIQGLEPIDRSLFDSVAHLTRMGTVLDRFYIPTRYPNGLPDLTPAEAFTADDAEVCLEYANTIVEAVRPLVSGN
jgi:HEPN domain-containing protein